MKRFLPITVLALLCSSLTPFHVFADVPYPQDLDVTSALPQEQDGERDSGVETNVAETEDSAPVDLVADSLEHDEALQTVTAIGSVELVQNGRILRADRISYNLETDVVRAIGNVVVNEVSGETYFAEEFELRNQMKDGFAIGVRGLLNDGGRFTANDGTREDGTKLIMNDAIYTACEPCAEHPDRAPAWRLAASEVVHDAEDNRIIYKNARLELAGVPVLYTPYFSHPDGSIDQKSGLLIPSFGFDSELGTSYSQEYYWAIDQDRDATIGAMVATDVNPLITGEYRQRFENAAFEIAGGVTYSDRFDESNGVSRHIDDEVRGHVIAEGLWDINNKWRAGIDSEWASDDQYMRQYNISSEDILENRLYAERFSGRDYAQIQTLLFQDIRTSERREDQPGILPEIEASFIGDAGQTFGGRWDAGFSMLSLLREGNDQDMVRAGTHLGWERQLISPIGTVTKLNVLGRGESYYISDRDIADSEVSRSNDTTKIRGFIQGNIETSYPFVNNFEKFQTIVEPVAAFSIGNNVNVDGDVPNEDSQDTVIDAMNLFEANRFSGLDRVEDRSKATYGLRTGFYGHGGYSLELFGGQSYRFDSDDNPFSAGSGLDDDQSDVVGMANARFGPYLSANYRFQLDNDNLSSQRHEADVSSNIGPLSYGARYFYGVGLEDTEVTETREQLIGNMRFKIDDNWSTFGGIRYDFGEDEGLRRATYGIDYEGQCYNISATANRSLTTESSGDSGTEIFFRIGLKTLGEFSTSRFTIGGDDGSDDDIEDDVLSSTND